MNNSWLLPQGIEESLPPEARQLEAMRRQLLDTYARWGYQLVMPPFIEYLDSLLTGTGHDLNLQTFQLVDQLSGRVMGVRADMTPQVARIDAHQLKREAPNRLCYIGTVLHTRPDGFGGSRSPMQVLACTSLTQETGWLRTESSPPNFRVKSKLKLALCSIAISPT